MDRSNYQSLVTTDWILEEKMTVQEAGRKGGLSRSPRKIASSRRNAAIATEAKKQKEQAMQSKDDSEG